MIAGRLKTGDTIGIIAPSQVALIEEYENIIASIEKLGFRVKTGRNIYKATYGYLASERERADDLNDMVSDDAVRLVFFGGGEGALELLPYIDYDNIMKHPKLFLSYSDGTSILNAIYSKTGLITYYGQTPSEYVSVQDYTYEQFVSHLVRGAVSDFISNSKWYCLNAGICEGTLIGGYLLNFVLMLNGEYLQIDKCKKYILFLEDRDFFNCVAAVSMYLSCIEQCNIIDNVCGLLFGSYSDTPSTELLGRLKRFGIVHGIPVAYCDDFGHGKNHAILPVGCRAILNTNTNTMKFLLASE